MRRILSVAGAALLLIGMTGCVESEPGERHRSSPRATPVFASDEEALAAAEAAYAAYLLELDAALSTYDTAKLKDVAADTALAEALESVEGFQDEEEVLTGHSSADSARLIQVQSAGNVDIYVCLDVSKTDILDRAGQSTLTGSGPTRYPMQVALTWTSSRETLIVAEAEVWGGGNFCG